jgi:hypothetical protein
MDREHHSRQSFLGPELLRACEVSEIGVVGLGGGGSHVVQQLAHVGFQKFTAFDPDCVEFSNLNRLVGATERDAFWDVPKVNVAGRLIQRIQGRARFRGFQNRWQDQLQALLECDLVFGCLDSLSERDQLERVTRAHLIPYIDIGMTVATVPPDPPRMAGQLFVSMPGGPCMRCMGMLRPDELAREREVYGDAGPNPQVVWANGILASSAVGLAVGILTGWHGRDAEIPYFSYDGNECTFGPHVKWKYQVWSNCPHFPADAVGPPRYRRL